MASNYPAGAEHDKNAPYNQPPDNEPVKVNVDISISLSISGTVETTDYSMTIDDFSGRPEYDFSCSNLEDDYKSSPDFILTLLKEYSNILESRVKEKEHLIESFNEDLNSNDKNTVCSAKRTIRTLEKEINELKGKIYSCNKWTVDELCVIPE